MKRVLIYAAILFFFSNCEKKTDWTLQSAQNNLLVVDGTITDEMKAQTIKLTFSVSQLNGVPQAVSGAVVNISNEDSAFQLMKQPVNSGIYVTSNNFKGYVGKDYTLLIRYNDNIYSAKTIMLPGLPFDFLQYTKNNKR